MNTDGDRLKTRVKCHVDIRIADESTEEAHKKGTLREMDDRYKKSGSTYVRDYYHASFKNDTIRSVIVE